MTLKTVYDAVNIGESAFTNRNAASALLWPEIHISVIVSSVAKCLAKASDRMQKLRAIPIITMKNFFWHMLHLLYPLHLRSPNLFNSNTSSP